jgi:hypothetical protein
MWLFLWNLLRNFTRLGLLALFFGATLAMGVVSWQGLAAALRPEVPAIVLAFSVFARINVFMLAGSYCFAAYVWHVPFPQSLLYIIPALGFIYPPALIDVVKVLWRPSED